MDVKERLKNHASLLRKIQITERQIESLKERLTSANTINPERISVQGGEQADQLPLKLYQIESMQNELAGLRVLREQEYDLLWGMVSSLSNNDEATVLHSYYFLLEDREETAKQLFGDKEDFAECRKQYLRKVSNLHTSALSKLRRREKIQLST
ncbi:MAG: hypothetical protein FWC99_01675 [Coriobacteriia bacterium]|nr:hypothetical protein [Coriobacteriia bacterium]